MEPEARDYENYPRIEPDDPTGGDPADAPEAGEDPDALPVPKADLGKRLVAGIIDAVASALVSLIPAVGGLVAAAYWLLRDGLDVEILDRRSLGKKLTKLRPVRDDGLPMDIETSIKRNWMFAIGGLVSVLFVIPIIGWLLIPVVIVGSIAIAAIEIFLAVTDPEGRRFGDKFAGTRVIEVGE